MNTIKSKRFVVMCNGEITNYLQLKIEMYINDKDLNILEHHNVLHKSDSPSFLFNLI